MSLFVKNDRLILLDVREDYSFIGKIVSGYIYTAVSEMGWRLVAREPADHAEGIYWDLLPPNDEKILSPQATRYDEYLVYVRDHGGKDHQRLVRVPDYFWKQTNFDTEVCSTRFRPI